MENRYVDKKLTLQEQKELHSILLTYLDLHIEGDHGILYDEEGEEFYGYNINLQYDFSTLNGFIFYLKQKSYSAGYDNCQSQIRKSLGL